MQVATLICGAFNASTCQPPAHYTPLRANACIFAANAGYAGFDVKVKENREACMRRTPAWDVYVRKPGDKRGKKIGAMLDSACDAFGPYSYNF